jgi:ribonuclease HII
MRAASRHVERLLYRLGCRAIAGLDEVGMGPLAGPVVAAAVVLPRAGRVPAVADSKSLTAPARERLARAVRRVALGVGIGVVEAVDVDRLNIYRAGVEAMRRALAALSDVRPDFLLVDGREITGIGLPQACFPKADTFVASVAAASIVAKVERDAIMTALDRVHPGYGFASHKGYGTPAHLAALAALGACAAHRRSFAPVALAGPRVRGDSRQG